MTDFHAELDALVTGDRSAQSSELARFVAGLYDEERAMTMSTTARISLAEDLGLKTGPVSNLTTGTTTTARSQPRWFTYVAVAAAAIIALTGLFRWSLPDGNDNDGFFGVASAIPTVQATPLAGEQVPAWMLPITAAECPVDELQSVNATVNPSSIWYTEEDYATVSEEVVYGPFRQADAGDADAVVNRVRQFYACSLPVYPNQTLQISSPRFEYEKRTTSGRMALAERAPERLEAAKELSAFYETELGLTPQTMMIHEPNSDLAAQSYVDGGINNLNDPRNVVELADGRMAVMLSLVGYGETFPYDISNEPTYVPPVFLMIEIDGQWYVDETLQLCLGDCDAWWAEMEFGTPVAWQEPISSTSCSLEATAVGTPDFMSAEEYEALPARVDEPFSAPDETTRAQVARTAREIRECMNTISIDSFWSDRLRFEESDRTFSVSDEAQQMEADRIARGKALSAYYTYDLGVTADTFILRYDQGDPEVEGLNPGNYTVLNPDWIVQLEDGRVAVLLSGMIVQGEEYPWQQENIPAGNAWILTLKDGEWVIDETLPVCFGTDAECTELWKQHPGWTLYQESQVTPTPTKIPTGGDNAMATVTPTVAPAIELIEPNPTAVPTQ
ncbi:MAG: hypothetical protein KC435_04035 [Thermomicrobiales bacterium]|nr:hypothetical protein [Thermomicrobiales bacterium]